MAKKRAQSGSGKAIAKLKAKQQKKMQPPSDATTQGPMLQAMVWYKEEHYQPLLKIFDDAELLPPSYADWLKRAEEKKKEVETSGHQVMKVFIDPETFPQWCESKKLAKDANARSTLAIEVAQSKSFSL